MNLTPKKVQGEWHHTGDGKHLIAKCPECAHVIFAPRPRAIVCPNKKCLAIIEVLGIAL